MNNRQLSLIFLVITGVSTIGSLYFSIGLGLIPCQYCWFQRVFMYPLAIISCIGIYKQTTYTDIYLVLGSCGLLIAGYHSVLQRIGPESACTSGCAEILYTVGIFSIPNLSFIGFFLTVSFALYVKYGYLVSKVQ